MLGKKLKKGRERNLEEVGELEVEQESMKPQKENWGRGGGGSELETSGQLELESAPNRISVSDLLIIYSRCNFSYQ